MFDNTSTTSDTCAEHQLVNLTHVIICYTIAKISEFFGYNKYCGFASYQLLELIMAALISTFKPFLFKVLENLKNNKPIWDG